MAFFNLFKKKQGQAKEASPQAKVAAVQSEKEAGNQKKIVAQDPSGIILRPHTSEKASELLKTNEYVFEVLSRATKSRVREAVRRMYGVDVLKVRIMNTKPNKVRVGRFQGIQPGFKKAMVRLVKGQKIDSLSP